MEIKLYNESSDRPHGSYTKVNIVTVYPNGILKFVSSNGDLIVTNLRFKAKIEDTGSELINYIDVNGDTTIVNVYGMSDKT